ncbi:MAG: polysaccharide deacetylase family protein [Gammaproteobacteria bacterium]
MSPSSDAGSGSRWRRRPLLPASLAIHAAATGMVGWNPAFWPWALGLVLSNHAVLAATGLWPRSSWLGPNWSHLPATTLARGGRVAFTLDDGPDPAVTPLVLDVLDGAGVRATFFCVGELIAAHPALGREILARGHCIENHSQRHLHHFSVLGPRRMKLEVARAQDTIFGVTGQRPRFFRAPAGLRNPFLDGILADLDLQLASWTRRGFDTLSRRPEPVLKRLTRRLGDGDILLLHDGNAARTHTGRPVILEVLPKLLETVARAGLQAITLREALS